MPCSEHVFSLNPHTTEREGKREEGPFTHEEVTSPLALPCEMCSCREGYNEDGGAQQGRKFEPHSGWILPRRCQAALSIKVRMPLNVTTTSTNQPPTNQEVSKVVMDWGRTNLDVTLHWEPAEFLGVAPVAPTPFFPTQCMQITGSFKFESNPWFDFELLNVFTLQWLGKSKYD